MLVWGSGIWLCVEGSHRYVMHWDTKPLSKGDAHAKVDIA